MQSVRLSFHFVELAVCLVIYNCCPKRWKEQQFVHDNVRVLYSLMSSLELTVAAFVHLQYKNSYGTVKAEKCTIIFHFCTAGGIDFIVPSLSKVL